MATALLVLALVPRGARGGTPPKTPGRCHCLDETAAFGVVLRPGALFQRAALLRDSLALWPEAARLAASSQQLLGIDFLDPESFARSGLDEQAPVAISLFATDLPTVRAVYSATRHALARSQWRTLPPAQVAFVRHRIVARLADPARFSAFLEDQQPVSLLSLQTVQRILKPPPRAASTIHRRLRAAATVALGRLPGDGLLLVRAPRERLVIIDLVQPWLGARPRRRHAAARLAHLCLEANPRGWQAPSLPADTLMTVHLPTPGLLTLTEVALREEALASVAKTTPRRRGRLLAATDERALTCRHELVRALGRATLTGGAIAVREVPGGLELRLTWRLLRHRSALTLQDDRLASFPRLAAETTALLGIRLDLGRLPEAIPRTGPWATSLSQASRFLSGCGPTATVLATVRLWPELLAAAIAEARHERDAGAVVRGSHNLLVGLHRTPGGQDQIVALASLDPAAATAVSRIARTGRTPRFLHRFSLSPRRAGIIAATDARTLRRARAVTATRPPLATALMELRADAPLLLRGSPGETPTLERTRRRLAGRVGLLHGTLTLRQETLEAVVRLTTP